MTGLALFIYPVVKPAHHATLPGGKSFFKLEKRFRGEKFFPETTHRLCSLEARSIRFGVGAFKHTVLSHTGHYPIHIVPVKSFVKTLNHGKRSRRHSIQFTYFHIFPSIFFT